MRAITGQQLSVLAARAIYARLTARYGDRPPTPQEILAEDPEELRAAAGLSRAKTAYLRSLAEHVISGELELERLEELPDEQVIEELVAVKGLGLWTAQMFLMFQLERPDVLPTGDLGIRNAIQRAYALAEPPERRSRWRRSPSRGGPTGRSPAASCGARCTTSPPEDSGGPAPGAGRRPSVLAGTIDGTGLRGDGPASSGKGSWV